MLMKEKQDSPERGRAMTERCNPKPGDWVLLKDDTAIACDHDFEQVARLADKYKPGEVVISKEPISQHCYY